MTLTKEQLDALSEESDFLRPFGHMVYIEEELEKRLRGHTQPINPDFYHHLRQEITYEHQSYFANWRKSKLLSAMLKAFQAGDLETFRKFFQYRLLPINFCDINITNLLSTLFVAEKYFEQKEMLNMIEELQ